MIIIPSARGHRYAVIGLGISGMATVRSLQASQAEVWAWDDKEASRSQAASAGIPVRSIEQLDWPSLTALVLSPGIPHLYPVPHISAQKAREAGIPIICDIDLLAQACPEAYYIGITGTNGKSTTTALIDHLLRTAKHACQTGGNIGMSALALAPLAKEGTYVLELSSYQLERVPHLELDIAVLLNITSDHLTRHGGLKGYIAAKKTIFERTRKNFTGIIGIDDPYCRSIYEELKTRCTLIPVSTHYDKGIYLKDKILYDEGEPVFDLAGNIFLPGLHNAQNIAVAYAVGKLRGIDRSEIIKGIQSFRGLAHRLECIGQLDGVRFINDSKATNAEAVARALACFDHIYWIVGGQAKEGGLKGLEDFFPRIRHAFLIGEASQEFEIFLKGKVPLTPCGTLENATRKAFAKARDDHNNPVLLLSPACASWDQFKNFEHRGETFKEIFQDLNA